MTWPANAPQDPAPDAAQRRQWRQRFAAHDKLAGIEVTEDFTPFNQMNDLFTRAFWDNSVRSKDTDGFFESHRMEATPRRGEGFNLKDFALRNAAWSISNIISSRSNEEGKREGFQAPIEDDTPVANERLEISDVAAFTAEVEHIARLFGADLFGVTEVDERWHYTSRVDTRGYDPAPNDLHPDIAHVIVLGHAMDPALVATYPSALGSASAGLEYSHEAAIVIQLASYIRNLGYQATGSMNDTALAIPYAIKAGLGEYGRNQMVITPQFGPRVRFSKIFTSAPLLVSRPRRFGITQYCDRCTKCAEACPPKALPFGAPTTETASRSTIKGVRKWSANCEKCFGYWAKLRTDCAICMRVCPFNRDFANWQNRLFRVIATCRFRGLALWWERRAGLAARVKAGEWWRGLAGKV